MSDYTVTIPESLYEQAERLATAQSQPIDELISTRLKAALDDPFFGLSDDEQAELKAMAYLSDDALLGMMQAQMPRSRQQRMSELMPLNTHGTISEDEHHELTVLVEAGQRLTLRKATAMKLLMERGHNVRLDDMKAGNE